MNEDIILQKISKIISKVAEVDLALVLPDANYISDLGADSMSLIEVMVAMEKEFRVVIKPEFLTELLTARTATQLIFRLIHE